MLEESTRMLTDAAALSLAYAGGYLARMTELLAQESAAADAGRADGLSKLAPRVLRRVAAAVAARGSADSSAGGAEGTQG